VVYWVIILYSVIVTSILEEHAASIFKIEDKYLHIEGGGGRFL
jgi:hypothetical protein